MIAMVSRSHSMALWLGPLFTGIVLTAAFDWNRTVGWWATVIVCVILLTLVLVRFASRKPPIA
jgi:hypothetical protein